MTITRVQAETLLVRRCGPTMTAAGMAVTIAGSNADLDDPLQWSIIELGGTVADIIAVTDADLATVASDDERYILDVAELRLLDNILSNNILVDTTVGPHSERLDQLAKRLERRRQWLADYLKDAIGLGASSITTGLLVLDFAEHVDA